MAAIIVIKTETMTNPQPKLNGTNRSAEAKLKPNKQSAKMSKMSEMYKQFNMEQEEVLVITNTNPVRQTSSLAIRVHGLAKMVLRV